MGLEQHDDASKYSLDLFESPRDGRDITMLFDLVRRARQYHQMRDREQFYQAFPLELSRLQGLGGSAEQAVESMFQLHNRFGDEIVRVIEKGLEHYKPVLAAGRMNPHSLLTLVVGDRTGPSAGNLSRTDELADGARHQQIELLIVPKRGQYSINGLDTIRAPMASALLHVLAENHKRHADQPADKIPYVATSQLERTLRTGRGALRRLVVSLRRRITIELKASGIQNPDHEAVVQSKLWKGYRLNPAVRVISK